MSDGDALAKERRPAPASRVGINLRSLLFMLWQAALTPPYAVAVLLTFPLSRIARYRFITGWCRLVIGAARLLCGIRHQVIGRENLGPGPYVILAKHSSTFETLALSYMFAPISYVAKQELLWIPFFGWGFALASPITIDRSRGPEAMQRIAEQGRRRFAQGFWLLFFPEGTRIPAGKRGRYKSGGTRLASMLPAPVLPIAHNAGYLWAKKRFAKYPGTITISIGKPIETAGRDPMEVMREVEAWIEEEVARLGDPRRGA
jgi:1-acyl-sn-glycerol-3-phosphate acyltransferase